MIMIAAYNLYLGGFLPEVSPKNSIHNKRELKNKNRLHISAFGVSVAGGITHNIGQFAVAAWLVGPSAILPYFPFLYFSGLIAGGLIGAFVLLCRQRIPLFSSTN